MLQGNGVTASRALAREALRWWLAEVDSEGRARLEPYAARQSLVRELDETAGQTGWSFTLAPLGGHALVGNLTVGSVTRAAVVNAGPAQAEAAADVALARCAALFGMRLPYLTEHDTYWVDRDPEAHEPLYEPEPVPFHEASGGEAGGTPAAAVDRSLPSAGAGHEVIERLVERLRTEGLGKEAAQLVVRYNGYGRSRDESRELYGRLRALLKGGGET